MGKRKKISVFALATVLLFSSSVYAEDEAVSCTQSIQKVSEEVYKNPYGEPFKVKCTAYCKCVDCCGRNHGITKSGKPAVEGITVESNVYYGKTIALYDEEVNFLGFYEVTDTGADGIDIYMDSHEAALEFGVHYYYIQVTDAVG